MKNYRMKAEAKDHFVLHDTRDGKTFKVAKSGLSSAHMDKVRKLADGGDVEGDDGDDSGATDTGIPSTGPSNLESFFNNTSKPKPPEPTIAPEESANLASPSEISSMASSLPKASKEGAAPEAVNPNTQGIPPAGGMMTTSYEGAQNQTPAADLNSLAQENDKIVGDQVKAIQASANAAQASAQQQAKIYDDNAKKMQAVQNDTQLRYAALDKEQQQLQQDVASSKIDPTRVWSSASTGNKILAGIGVLLSGVGSGLTGGPNMAMQVINKTIDNDIAAQKAELGKKENLLSMNYRKYGDLRAATVATQLQLNSTLQGQIAAQTARAAGPAAQANAAMAVGQLQQQAHALKTQLAMAGIKNQIISGGAPSVPPAMVEGMGLSSRAVETPMGTKFAKTPEAAKEANATLTSLDTIDKRLDDMYAFAKNTGTTAPFTANNAVAKSLKAQVIQELGELNGLKRLTGEEVELRKDQVPDPGSLMTDKAIAQIQLLKQFVKEKREAEYKSQLVNYNPGKSSGRDVPTGATLTNWKP